MNEEVVNLRFKKTHDHSIPPPAYATTGSAGLDIRSSVEHIIYPAETKLFPTGYLMSIPVGYEGQIRSRSGLSLRHGIIVLNSPGTIDSDYRGELMVMLYNQSSHPFNVNVGDRIAQMVISKIPFVTVTVVNELDETDRGSHGFGWSGTK